MRSSALFFLARPNRPVHPYPLVEDTPREALPEGYSNGLYILQVPPSDTHSPRSVFAPVQPSQKLTPRGVYRTPFPPTQIGLPLNTGE